MNTIIIFGAKYLIIIPVILTVYFFWKQDSREKKCFLIFASISLPLTFILVLIANHLIYDPRPFVVGNFIPLIPHIPDNGFPSDHTVLIAALAALVYFFNKKWSLPIWVLAVLVGWARIAAGVHHVSDVIGSLAIAILGAFATKYILSFFRHYKHSSES